VAACFGVVVLLALLAVGAVWLLWLGYRSGYDDAAVSHRQAREELAAELRAVQRAQQIQTIVRTAERQMQEAARWPAPPPQAPHWRADGRSCSPLVIEGEWE
jgi:CHASE3 domain sensor protein